MIVNVSNRQAIVTKYHGATNTLGSRVSASAEAGRVVLSWDHGKNVDDNHRAAALELMARKGWQCRELVGGSMQGAMGYAWVMMD